MDNERSRNLADALRRLPSVDRVLRHLEYLKLPPALLTAEVRSVLEERRQAILSGDPPSAVPIEECVAARLQQLLAPSFRRVINATGVVLHTNLGRAPLPAFLPSAGYSNLEYDLEAGRRGSRDAHTSKLLEALLGCPAIVVNNNAAAVYLVLHELASGREAIVSRGELIEIGDGFRIPEIMARSGALLREVGTTNRTRLADYANAIGESTALIMRVHPSNFQIRGFTSRPELQELTALGRERGVPVYEDLGSGCVSDLRAFGVHEPLVSDSLKAGAGLVSFSGDKLLGGPQCGIVAGSPELVRRIRRNPMYRAFRIDKLIVEALETTLRNVLLEKWDQIPALHMIGASETLLKDRAQRVAANITKIETSIRAASSPIGGGSTPDQLLPSWVIELSVANAARFEKELRRLPLPVIARIERNAVILDMRTVFQHEEEALAAGVMEALGHTGIG